MKKYYLFVWILYCITKPSISYSLVMDPSPCFRDLQLHFFQLNIVADALSLYTIPQGVWNPVVRRLQVKSLEVPDRLRAKTAGIIRNPIAYPMEKTAAAQILKATLFEVFLETLQEFQVQEQPTANLMFDYILSRQQDKFINCFGEGARILIPSP